ncbi:Crp/Fnr family transcriptional regulator [Sphingorhabdus arenilitoris]|uniref:Crp/Fnr family transcriptional regulator n=1 Tax=Sphingorhabdus arenilitoris TaxID=1490041 RepID=A0ABV8RJ59_9SPHN
MPTSLHSRNRPKFEATGRTIGSPILFRELPADIRTQLMKSAVMREFQDGQIIQQRGDPANGFWLIEKGQVKIGRFSKEGNLQVLLIFGEDDSFGELACLGGFSKVVDAVDVGKSRLKWVSERDFWDALANSPETMRHVMRTLAAQLQESLDNLVAIRKMPAKKQLARAIIALCGTRAAPVHLVVRQSELAELIGVSRMTISTVLTEMEEAQLIQRKYRGMTVADPAALRQWMRSQ